MRPLSGTVGPSALPSIRVGTRGVTRRFGALVANDAIDLAVAPGSIHAIVGGNGAGKTTLMRLLQGMDRPDAGTVVVNDAPVAFTSPADAFAHGIGMVHQEFMLVPGLSLLENLILAHEPAGRLGLIDTARARAEAAALERQAGLALDWDQLAELAPVHVRQVVEILRLLFRGVDVLILDEPTAVLAPAQVAELIALLRRLRAGGRTILFISHKLDEVLAVADRITVLRGGRVIGTVTPAETSRDRLAQMMTGTPVAVATPGARSRGAPVLRVETLAARDRNGAVRLNDVSLEVCGGEIVGIAGVAGNGQDELVACIAGLLPAERGRIALAGTEVAALPVAQRRRLGLGYLSADRAGEGLCLPASIAENAIAGQHRRPGLCRHGVLRPGAIAAHVERLLDRFSVVRRSAAMPVGSLSGGNQQRVAIARELDAAPRLLLACQPTRGVDIAGTAFIHRCLIDYCAGGGAVLLVSEELDELLALSDRIIVLYGGRVMGEVARGAGVEILGRLMLGEAVP
jgi:ABC-type uncharacterized transport system ATPase subunit